MDANGRGSINIAATVDGEAVTTELALVVADENGGVFLDRKNDEVFLGTFQRQTSALDPGRFAGTHVYSIDSGDELVIGRVEFDGAGAVMGGNYLDAEGVDRGRGRSGSDSIGHKQLMQKLRRHREHQLS